MPSVCKYCGMSKAPDNYKSCERCRAAMRNAAARRRAKNPLANREAIQRHRYGYDDDAFLRALTMREAFMAEYGITPEMDLDRWRTFREQYLNERSHG